MCHMFLPLWPLASQSRSRKIIFEAGEMAKNNDKKVKTETTIGFITYILIYDYVFVFCYVNCYVHVFVYVYVYVNVLLVN